MQGVLQNLTVNDSELVERVFDRVAVDLGMIIDREIQVHEVQCERSSTRVAGEGGVHISFKLGFYERGNRSHGCLLLPLPDAMTMAGLLMMLEEEEIELLRSSSELERSEKDALLEVGNFMAGACGAVVRTWFQECATHSEGCQGVRAGVRPAFDYVEGDVLLIGRAWMQLEGFEPFQVTLMMPVLGRASQAA